VTEAEQKTALVIGGTGLVGTPIVRQLDRTGWKVRVMSRNATRARESLGPRVELVRGDANRAADVEGALSGCDAALISVSDLLDPYLDARVARSVAELGQRLGIGRVGLISGASVAEERRHFPMVDAKVQAEQSLRESGLPWVIVRLTWPMESLVRFVRGKHAMILGEQPAVLHPVAGADVGRMVERALSLDEAIGHTFTIHGPSAMTMRQWLEQYCALAAPDARVSSLPLWAASLVAKISRKAGLRAAVELMRYFDGLPEFGDPTEANRILGAPTITLVEWVESRAGAAPAKAA
jgi:uncharacterized protein YbjT (DUF2867 family)